MKLTTNDWKEVWEALERTDRSATYQRMMRKKHGNRGQFFYEDPDELWEIDKRSIKRIGNKILKAKQ
jgi:hypothetical protein